MGTRYARGHNNIQCVSACIEQIMLLSAKLCDNLSPHARVLNYVRCAVFELEFMCVCGSALDYGQNDEEKNRFVHIVHILSYIEIVRSHVNYAYANRTTCGTKYHWCVSVCAFKICRAHRRHIWRGDDNQNERSTRTQHARNAVVKSSCSAQQPARAHTHRSQTIHCTLSIL